MQYYYYYYYYYYYCCSVILFVLHSLEPMLCLLRMWPTFAGASQTESYRTISGWLWNSVWSRQLKVSKKGFFLLNFLN